MDFSNSRPIFKPVSLCHYACCVSLLFNCNAWSGRFGFPEWVQSLQSKCLLSWDGFPVANKTHDLCHLVIVNSSLWDTVHLTDVNRTDGQYLHKTCCNKSVVCSNQHVPSFWLIMCAGHKSWFPTKNSPFQFIPHRWAQRPVGWCPLSRHMAINWLNALFFSQRTESWNIRAQFSPEGSDAGDVWSGPTSMQGGLYWTVLSQIHTLLLLSLQYDARRPLVIQINSEIKSK